MWSPTLFTLTFQYFYTDISAISVAFRNSDVGVIFFFSLFNRWVLNSGSPTRRSWQPRCLRRRSSMTSPPSSSAGSASRRLITQKICLIEVWLMLTVQECWINAHWTRCWELFPWEFDDNVWAWFILPYQCSYIRSYHSQEVIHVQNKFDQAFQHLIFLLEAGIPATDMMRGLKYSWARIGRIWNIAEAICFTAVWFFSTWRFPALQK